jgi:hypothetical protein
MPISDRDMIVAEFEPAKKTIGWAKDAIHEFHTAAREFFGVPDLVRVSEEFDPKTGEQVQKGRIVREIPSALARRATEALTNSRHAFDQAIFAARNITTGRSNKSIYYPWAQNVVDLEHLLRNRGIDQRLWDTIKAHEPYPRSDSNAVGNNDFRTLAQMANDKHTVGLAVVGHLAGVKGPPMRAVKVKSFRSGYIRWDAKKNECEFARWIGEVEMQGNYQFSFEIILNDPRLSQPVNAPAALVAFADKANAVVETLQVRCLEISGF